MIRITIVIALLLARAVDARAQGGPARPATTNLQVTVNPDSAERKPVQWLWFSSVVSPDTAALEITIVDKLGSQVITTTPDATYLSSPDLRLVPGPIDVAIVAIDRDGRRSEPDRWQHVEAEQRRGCGGAGALYMFAILPLGFVALFGLLVAITLIRALVRRAAARREAARTVGPTSPFGPA